MKTVLVTGATGYLGRALCRSLAGKARLVCLKRRESPAKAVEELGRGVTWVDADSDSELQAAFRDRSIDAVVHMATHYGRDGDLLAVFKANLLLPIRLAQLCLAHGVQEFINADSYYNKSEHACGHLGAYTMSKRQALEWLSLFAGRMSVVNVKIEHVYGPGDADSKFANSLARRMLAGEESLQLTSGEQKRDFIYVDDVVSAFEAVLDRPGSRLPGLGLFEAGRGESIPVRDFIVRMKERSGSSSRLDFGALPMREGEIMESRADTSALLALGWAPKYTIEAGLDALLAGEDPRTRVSTESGRT